MSAKETLIKEAATTGLALAMVFSWAIAFVAGVSIMAGLANGSPWVAGAGLAMAVVFARLGTILYRPVRKRWKQ